MSGHSVETDELHIFEQRYCRRGLHLISGFQWAPVGKHGQQHPWTTGTGLARNQSEHSASTQQKGASAGSDNSPVVCSICKEQEGSDELMCHWSGRRKLSQHDGCNNAMTMYVGGGRCSTWKTSCCKSLPPSSLIHKTDEWAPA